MRYAGIYTSDLYGNITLAFANGGLTLSRPTAAAALVPDRANRFKARWTSDSLLSVFGETPVGFTIGATGDVTTLELGPDAFKREDAPALAQRRGHRRYGKKTGRVKPPVMYWGKYVAHDNNRDGMGQMLRLTQNITRGTLDWHPTVLHDLRR